MYRYLAMSSYNEVGAAALLSQGFKARSDQFQGLIEALGGTLESYYYSDDGHVVVFMSFDEPQNFALSGFQGMASGTWLERVTITRVHDGQEMDDALAQQVAAYEPAGA